MLKGVIFDLDGVVVNTVPLHFKAWQKLFAGLGIEFSWQVYRSKVDGISAIDAVKAVAGYDNSRARQAAELKSEYFNRFLEKQAVEVYPDTLRFIKKIIKQQVKTAVISSSRNCRYILGKAGILDRFDSVVSGSEVENGKPSPDIFLKACEKLRLENKDVWACEDAVLGVLACRNAAIKCIGIARDKDKQRLAQADLVVESFDEVDIRELDKKLRPEYEK